VTTSFVANDLKYTEAFLIFYYIIKLFVLYGELTVVVVSRHMSACAMFDVYSKTTNNMCVQTSKDSKGAMCYAILRMTLDSVAAVSK